MAPGNASRLMADRLMGGSLTETLTRYRLAGTPWEVIARLLQDYGVVVSARTLTRWASELGVPEPDREPAS